MVRKILFTPDGRQLISISDDKTIRVWDVASGEVLRVHFPPKGPGPVGMLYAAALSPDGRTLAIGGCYPYYNSSYYGFSREHGIVKRVYPSSQIYLIALTEGDEKLFRDDMSATLGLAFAPVGRRLASVSIDKDVRIWDIGTGKVEQKLGGHRNECPDARLVVVRGSPDDSLLDTSARP